MRRAKTSSATSLRTWKIGEGEIVVRMLAKKHRDNRFVGRGNVLASPVPINVFGFVRN